MCLLWNTPSRQVLWFPLNQIASILLRNSWVPSVCHSNSDLSGFQTLAVTFYATLPASLVEIHEPDQTEMNFQWHQKMRRFGSQSWWWHCQAQLLNYFQDLHAINLFRASSAPHKTLGKASLCFSCRNNKAKAWINQIYYSHSQLGSGRAGIWTEISGLRGLWC